MAKKMFLQDEVNRIIAVRMKRERERVVKEFENRMKRCMSSIHLTLYQEMCALKREITNGGGEIDAKHSGKMYD